MSPGTIRSIRKRWTFCSTDTQLNLIRRYLERHDIICEEVLLEFLAEEFRITDQPGEPGRPPDP